MAVLLIGFDGLADGATVTAANSGFSSLAGSGALVASTSSPADGSACMAYTPQASTARQAIVTFAAATSQTSLVFKRRKASNMAATAEIARIYAPGTNMVGIRPVTDGRLTLTVAGTVVWTSTATVPLDVWVRYSLWAKLGPDGTTGSVRFDAYLGQDTTPIAGLSFSTDAAALGTAQFSSMQLVRPASSTDAVQELWDSFRIRTGADAAAQDTGPWVANQPPTVTPAPNVTGAEPGSTVTSSVIASDGDGSIASYTATAPGLTLTGSGSSRSFVVPLSLTAQTYTITWTVTDNQGAQTVVTQTVSALPCTVRVKAADGSLIPAILRVPQ